MYQEIIAKSRAFSFRRLFKYIKSYSTKMMDSTKIFDKNIDSTNVRKRSVPESSIQDNLDHPNVNQTKKGTDDTSNKKEPNGYYKGNSYNGENKYGIKIYDC